MIIWCDTRANKFEVSEYEAAEVYKKIRSNRHSDKFRSMDTTLSNGQTVQLSKTFVGYDCDVCSKEHIIFQKCPMEMTGACEVCGKSIQRFISDRNKNLNLPERCMIHRHVNNKKVLEKTRKLDINNTDRMLGDVAKVT